MVIAFVGAGSYVFGPSVLVQLLESELDGLELRLVDPNRQAIDPLAEAFASAAKRVNKRIKVSCHSSSEGALTDASYVIHSAAPGMRSAFRRDCEIIREECPGHLVSEFGGVHGIAYSLSQIRFLQSLGQTMAKECPQAWLFASANPLTRVCTAARDMGIKSAGFCSVAILAYRWVGSLLDGWEETYPFPLARAKYEISTAGTNHLSWIVRVRNKVTGEDLLPALRKKGSLDSPSKSLRYLARTGFLLAPGDDHINDFLRPEGIESVLEASSHGTDEERAQRLEDTMRVAQGEAPFSILDSHPSWEHPILAIQALEGIKPYRAVTLTLANHGQIEDLPVEAMVETPVFVDGSGFHPDPQRLPSGPLEHCSRAVALTEAIVRHGLHGDESALEEAVLLDPTILDPGSAMKAIRRCLAHSVLV
jgi:alpha-galactosidase/6-phospho-beta-glucosidase family protein